MNSDRRKKTPQQTLLHVQGMAHALQLIMADADENTNTDLLLVVKMLLLSYDPERYIDSYEEMLLQCRIAMNKCYGDPTEPL